MSLRGDGKAFLRRSVAALLVGFFLILSWLFFFAEAHAQNDRMRDIDQRLMEAVGKGDLEETKALLSKGANVNVRDEFGQTPLHGVEKRAMAELLISRGANVDAKNDDFGMTPLFNAATEVAEVLIAAGADVNVKARKGMTPLTWAMYWDDLSKVKLLLSRGADVNLPGEDMKTPLHVAANWNKTELAALLISKGARVNVRDEAGWTPLHWAAFEGGPEVIQLLISKGAEKDARTLKSWAIFPARSTPLDIAERAKSYTAGFLKSKGCRRGKDLK